MKASLVHVYGGPELMQLGADAPQAHRHGAARGKMVLHVGAPRR